MASSGRTLTAGYETGVYRGRRVFNRRGEGVGEKRQVLRATEIAKTLGMGKRLSGVGGGQSERNATMRLFKPIRYRRRFLI